MKEVRFSFEDLEVWVKAVEFAKAIINIAGAIRTGRRHYRLIEQLEAAAGSVALNIAEGSGRYSRKEFIRFLYIARGSLYETITLLILFRDNYWITNEQLMYIKDLATVLGKMLSGLINSLKYPKTMNHELRTMN